MLIAIFIGYGGDAIARGHGKPVGVVDISAYSKVGDVYHQLAAVVVEYSENVLAPDETGYTVFDYITPNLRDAWMRWPMGSEAPVTAVYTNNRPQMRADKTSVKGRYVVIELEPTTYCLPENAEGVNMLNHSAAMATIRTTDPNDQCDYRRRDWSDLVIIQNFGVENSRGRIVAQPQILPSLTYDKITHLEIDRFQHAVFVNSQGVDVNYFIYLPRKYNICGKWHRCGKFHKGNSKYPLFYYITGNGGRLNYLQTDAEGNLVNLGGPLTRDPFGIRATELPEDAIVVLPQLWRNAPASWNNVPVQDAIELLEYLLDEYSVDRQRVYAAGSSFGTSTLSSVMASRADLISGYVQFNGGWTGQPSAFYPEDSGALIGKDIAYIDGLPRVPKDAAWLDQARAAMGDAVARRIPVWISHAVNDTGTRAVSTYEALRALYQEEGMADADIDKLVKLVLFEDPEILSMGISERHNNVPVGIKRTPELFDWLLNIGN